MRFGTRVWGFGKLLVLIGALGATFLLFFFVSMRVAVRAREVEIPQLVGQTVNAATQAMANLGFGVRVEENARPDERVAAGRIMQQDLQAGTVARRGRTIRVWVSSGPRTTIVPPLVGQTERTARIRIEQDGLQIQSVSEFRSAEYAADTIVAQDPPPSARAPQVSILLNRGQAATTYVMPDVIGMVADRAADALRRRDFPVTIVGSQPYPGVPPGTVVQQQPNGGFQIAAGEPISLEVSQ
jgi:serine/threonine-protein kinase